MPRDEAALLDIVHAAEYPERRQQNPVYMELSICAKLIAIV